MTSTAPWTRYVARHPVYIRGAFENVHGERYLIYRNINDGYPGSKLYVTGDELDWEPKIGLIDESGFIWSDDEAVMIGRILFQVSKLQDEPRACWTHGHIGVLRKVIAHHEDERDFSPVLTALDLLEAALSRAGYDDIKLASDQVRAAWKQE